MNNTIFDHLFKIFIDHLLRSSTPSDSGDTIVNQTMIKPSLQVVWSLCAKFHNEQVMNVISDIGKVNG